MMTKRHLLFAAIALTVFCRPCEALENGAKAPAFKLAARGGGTVSLESYKGKVLYLDFWASWCASCKKSLPWMSRLKQEFARSNFEILAINLDSNRKDAERVLEELSSNLTILFDPIGETPERYQLRAMPSSFLIDQNGKIVASFEGFGEHEKSVIENRIRTLLGGVKS